MDPTRYEPKPASKNITGIFTENPLSLFSICILNIIYIINPICYDSVFGRSREHPDSDLDDSGSVTIVGTRATAPRPVCECFYFINYLFSLLIALD